MLKVIVIAISLLFVGGCVSTNPAPSETAAQPASPANDFLKQSELRYQAAAKIVKAKATEYASLTDVQLVEQAKKDISNRLTDPGSVQWKNFVVSPPQPDRPNRVVCGYFNAKNRLGGYTGFDRMFWSVGYTLAPQEFLVSKSDDLETIQAAVALRDSSISGQTFDPKTVVADSMNRICLANAL
jgi:hypothetical protein